MLAIHLLFEITGSCVHMNPDQNVKQLLQNTDTILKSMYIYVPIYFFHVSLESCSKLFRWNIQSLKFINRFRWLIEVTKRNRRIEWARKKRYWGRRQYKFPCYACYAFITHHANPYLSQIWIIHAVHSSTCIESS